MFPELPDTSEFYLLPEQISFISWSLRNPLPPATKKGFNLMKSFHNNAGSGMEKTLLVCGAERTETLPNVLQCRGCPRSTKKYLIPAVKSAGAKNPHCVQQNGSSHFQHIKEDKTSLPLCKHQSDSLFTSSFRLQTRPLYNYSMLTLLSQSIYWY